jgi:hypothetical protein
MASVMYQILNATHASPSTDEALRLAMLSLGAQTFLQWPRLRVPLPWLRTELKRALTDVMHDTGKHLLSSATKLWLLLVYGVTCAPLNAEEDCDLKNRLCQEADRCSLTTWADVRVVLHQYLWIDAVMSGGAQNLLERSLRCSESALVAR